MEFGVGSIVEGKVTGITKFGAFVSLPGGRSGLVHHLTEGQEVKVKVIGIDDSNRINLSIKKAMDPPPRPQRPAGQGGPRHSGYGSRQGGGRPGGARASSEPESFEERLKHFMQASDSKLSEMKYTQKRSSRRGRR